MISAPRMFELYWEPTRSGRYVHICDCRANWAAIDLRLGPSHGPIQGVKPRETSKGEQRGLPMHRCAKHGQDVLQRIARLAIAAPKPGKIPYIPGHGRLPDSEPPRRRRSCPHGSVLAPSFIRATQRAWGWRAVQSELGDGIS